MTQPTMQRTNNEKLTAIQHGILLGLIRGERPAAIAGRFGITEKYMSKILVAGRRLVGCRTVYQLVALEVINLMEDENVPLVESIQVKVMTAGAER